jgi:hypothetical protein
VEATASLAVEGADIASVVAGTALVVQGTALAEVIRAAAAPAEAGVITEEG